MATLPLKPGSVANCEWEGHGTMLLRDNQGAGDLIWISQYTALDIRVSQDDGATWSEPSALGSETVIGSAWVQDSEGNLHGVLPNGTSNAKYRKVTLARDPDGHITGATETTTFTLSHVTNNAMGRSWSIAIVNDGQTTAGTKERVAIAWMDARATGSQSAQHLSIRFTITTRAAGVSPTAASDFKAFDESAGVQTLRSDSGSTSGDSTAMFTKIAQMPGTAGTAKYRLYVGVRAYDGSNVSERFVKLYEAAWNGDQGASPAAPYWGSFSEKSSGSTPAETTIHNVDLLADPGQNRVVLCAQDYTSTTGFAAKKLNFWVVDANGTPDKDTTIPANDLSTGLLDPIRAGKLALDQDGTLWVFTCPTTFTGNRGILGVAKLSGGAWSRYFQNVYLTSAAPEDVVVSRVNNGGGRLFYAISTDGTNNDPCVMSLNLAAESRTLKESGGDYSSEQVAAEHVPDLVLADFTLTIHHKSGGWGAIRFGWSADPGNNAQTTVVANNTCLVRGAPGEQHAGKWDTTKVHFTASGADSTFALINVQRSINDGGGGTFKVEDIQARFNGTTASLYALRSLSGTSAVTATCKVIFNRCIAVHDAGATSGFGFALQNQNTYAASLTARNCASIMLSNPSGASTVTVGLEIENAGTGSETVENCSVYSASTSPATIAGVRQRSGSAIAPLVRNTAVEMATTTTNRAFVDEAGLGWGSSNYNAAGGAAATNDAPGTNSLDDLTAAEIAFVDKAAGDLHIGSGSSLKDSGTDLSGTFTDDIDGETRSGAWDIGADEFMVAAGPSAGLRTLALTGAGI